MEKTKLSEQLKTIKSINYVIAVFALIFLGLFYYLNDNFSNEIDNFYIATIVITFIGFLAAYYFLKKGYEKIIRSDDLDKKIGLLNINSIRHSAILEGVVLFNGLSYYFTGKIENIIIGIVAVAYMIYHIPNKNTIKKLSIF